MAQARLIPACLATLLCLAALQGCGEDGGRAHASAQGAGGSGGAGAGPRRDLVLITVDTTRADHLGSYGNPLPITPHLDALAKRGAVFERAYASMPQTLPSHATMLTGLVPRLHGALINSRRLPGRVTTLAEVLQAEGYRTGAAVGAVVLRADMGIGQGFEDFDQPGDEYKKGNRVVRRPAADVTDAALAWARRVDGRYFLWVHYYDPHDPFDEHGGHVRQQVPRPRIEEWVRARAELFPEEGVGMEAIVERWHGYACDMRSMDRQIGRLMRELAGMGLLDEAWVVVAGDHGEGLWEHAEKGHGVNVYEELMRVPLIAADPEGRLAGTRVSTQVALEDIFPTALELTLGAPFEGALSGRSLAGALLRGEALEERAVFFERPHFSRQRLTVRAGERNPDRLDWGVLAAVVHEGWKGIAHPDGRFALYDLAVDPEETRDLSALEPARARELEALLADWLERHPAPPPGTEPEDGALTAEQLEGLRALGYAGDG